MATIRCPHCNFMLELKGVRPGRFTPKCTQCGQPFLMEISDDPKPKAYVSKIKPKSKTDRPKTREAAPPPKAAETHDPPPRRERADSPLRAEPPKPAETHDPRDIDLASSEPLELEPAGAENLTLASPSGHEPADRVNITSDSDIELALPPDIEIGLDTPESIEDEVPPDDSTPAAEILDEPPSAAEMTAPSVVKKPVQRPATPTAPKPADPNATAVSQRPAGEQSPAPAPQHSGDLAGVLGGYQITNKLGEGGMGAVYRARQLSLDRDVALKTMHPQWSADPLFLARFTREAYAAAQLTHHQIVQIYDIGQDKETPFFSMEFVKGQSLADLMKRDGRVDPEAAAGYILQAARGLKFAHDQGMIHRDVKPENLLLNDQGIVKVADLGLVKTPGSPAAGEAAPGVRQPPVPGGQKSAIAQTATANVTLADVAMGTPAYMAPEQAVDAAKVDARADIYSLGCTLYALITGAAPFQGKTVMEVLTKHATEAITPPEMIVQRLPKELSVIIQKMTAKKPADRYQDMGQVITALETFLGVSTTGPFTPKQEHAELLEANVKSFYGIPIAKQRTWIILGFYAFCLLAVILLGLMHQGLMAGGVVGVALLTTAFYQAATGVIHKAYFFRKCRQLLFSSSFKDWLTYLVVIVLVLGLVYAFDLHWYWLGGCVVALGLAVGFVFTVDRHLAAERRGPVNHVEDMLKGMRLRGLEEQALRQFVCKYAGDRWESFYETLFGYEAKIEARELWGRGQAGRNRRRDNAWRDPIIRWIDQKMKLRREAREKKMLQAVEERGLRARGVSAGEAQHRAALAAETLVSKAAEYKDAATLPSGQKLPMNIRSITQAGDPDEEAAKRRERSRTRIRSGPLVWFFGRFTRFVVGCVLLYGCILWMQQNKMLSAETVRSVVPTAQGVQGIQTAGTKLSQMQNDAKPLQLALVPPVVTGFFNSINPGVAGLMLIISVIFSRWIFGAIVLLAAVVIVAGERMGIPSVGGLITAQYLSMAAGLALAALGFLFTRK